MTEVTIKRIDSSAWLVFVGLLPPFLYFLWCYFASRVECSESGIMQSTPFGRKFIPWSEITEVTESSDMPWPIIVQGKMEKLYICGVIDFRHLLVKTIRERQEASPDKDSLELVSSTIVSANNSEAVILPQR